MKTTRSNDFIHPSIEGDEVWTLEDEGGLTKREHFAGLALQGLIANGKYDPDWKADPDESFTTQLAVRFADALIHSLNARAFGEKEDE